MLSRAERIDWIDPAEAAWRLRPLGRLAWLDGARKDEHGRRSYLCAAPSASLSLVASDAEPLGALERFVAAAGAIAVGWLGYDLGRAVERLPARAAADLPLPDACVQAYPAFLRLDHEERSARLVGDAKGRAVLRAALSSGGARVETAELRGFQAEMGAAEHARGVSRILEYILAGDVYQVNLARRFRGRLEGDALALYQRLSARSPAPFGAYLEADDHAILSNSPERFLRVADGGIEAYPIKGTRPRGADDEADRRLCAELLADEKERAEHLMIVDLLRNDLGRVSEVGSIEVQDMMRVLSLETVHHLVSTVSGRLRRDVGLADILRATFPGGSITGAPKVRAMEIIEELEPVRRGPYTGAVGWFAPDGSLDLSIAIRTGILLGSPRTGGQLVAYAGGGIVADSAPAAELAETEAKILAWSMLSGG